jgi:hypothetical protein
MMPNKREAAKHRWLLPILACFIFSGCATRYIDTNTDKKSVADSFGDVVSFQTTEEFKANPPTCLGVLPLLAAQKSWEPTTDLRKALHANLATSGIVMIPMQKIDALELVKVPPADRLSKVYAATGCDTLLSGEITDRQTGFYGIYSEVKLAASVRITRVSNGSVIWKAEHTAIVRGGGIPLNPISIIGGAVSAGINLSDEQITRTTHDLARRLVFAIPNLKYVELESEINAKQAYSNIDVKKPLTIHAFISGIENLPKDQLESKLETALSDGAWTEPSDRLVLTDFLLSKDPQHTKAMYINAEAKLLLRNPEEALAMTNRLLLLDSKSAEVHFLKARSLMTLNQPLEAIEPLLKAAGTEQPKPMYFTAMGVVYNQIGDHAMAVAALTKSLSIQPDNAYALLQLGVANVGIGDDMEAAMALRKSMVLSIIAKDRRNAGRALSIFKSMDLTEQITPEELTALDLKISSL